LGIDHLWIIAVLAIFGVIVSLTPVPPNDFWWHLKIGQIIATTLTIPRTNLFAWTVPFDKPFIYGAWLADLLIYQLYHWGGVSLVIFSRTLMAVLSFGLVGFEAWRRSGSWRLAGIVVTIAAAMSTNNLEVRPQVWSWLPFLIFYILFSAYVEGKLRATWLIACPLVMVLWVNLHGAFVLGFVLIGIFLAGELIRRIMKFADARSWVEIAWIGIIGLLCILAALINPEFAGIFRYIANLMSDPSIHRFIEEWQPPAPTTYATILFFLSILMLFLTIVYARYTPTPTEALLLVGFIWLAWTGLRSIIWYAMVTMPVLAKALHRLLQQTSWLAIPRKNLVNLLLAVMLVIPFVLVQPWFVENMPLPEKYWKLVLRESEIGPLMSVNNPVEAVKFLEKIPGGRLFNEMGYGSYLIWELPRQSVFIDPRIELFPYEQWLDYIRISNGIRYNEILAKYGANRLLIDVKEQKELAIQLENDPLWMKEYEDPNTQVWIKSQ
jgi:hypothetical protein